PPLVPHSLPTRRSSDLSSEPNSADATFTAEDRAELLQTKVDYEERIVSLMENVDQLHQQIEDNTQRESSNLGDVTFTAEDRAELDRKSTRLNSSHVSIS